MTVALTNDVARRKRMMWPAAGVAAVLASTAYIALVDPNEAGHYPLCPLKYVTGIDCPACGGLRCVHSLANGDVAGALDHNLLAVLLLPLVVVWAAFALLRTWRGESKPITPDAARRQRILMGSVITLTVVFTIARNLPFVPYLSSGIG